MTTIDALNNPDLSSKGDLLAGTGSGARPVILPVGTDTYVLTANSAQTTGLEWVAPTTFSTGSFTPVLAFGGSSTGITYSDQEGQYTQLGNIVFFSFRIILSSKGSASGAATITGLPITAGNGLSDYQGPGSASTITLPPNTTQIEMVIPASSSTMQLYGTTPGSSVALTDSNFSNTSGFSCTLFYFTT